MSTTPEESPDLEERLKAAAKRGAARRRHNGRPASTNGRGNGAASARQSSDVALRAERAFPDNPEQQELIKRAAGAVERPELAPNLEFRGEMQESAFKEPPWLIVRDGKYIQVSKIQYDLAQQVDGRRNLKELAAATSQATSRKVTPKNARTLAINLMKLGVVAVPGFTDKPADRDSDGYRARSPLAINMRMAMLGPNVIDPPARIFQFLYWPPVALVALTVGLAAQVWLYFIHGVGGGLHESFYSPALFLAALVIAVLAAAFHEFGHAAALRYGGGKAGGMGAGLYIVYPAFYTDVTENYNLSRWSRVRTDLGGFYFHLLFALGVMGLYAVTGQEFLLLVVSVINLQIIQQLMPFVRLDGYWTLADLTGVPDFFSQMGAFLRTVLPSWFPIPDGPRLPELKLWTKVVFLGYVVITIPLLIFAILFLLRAAPRLVATVVDSLGVQFDTFSDALSSGDALAALAAAGQALILVLPIAALTYTLGWNLGRRLVTGIWNWSQGSIPRRSTATLGVAAFAALLTFLWAPQVFFGDGGSGLTRNANAFEPIGENERLNVSDVVRDERTPSDEAEPVDAAAADEEQEAEPTPAAEEEESSESESADSNPFPQPGEDEPTPEPEATTEPAEPTSTPTASGTAE